MILLISKVTYESQMSSLMPVEQQLKTYSFNSPFSAMVFQFSFCTAVVKISGALMP